MSPISIGVPPDASAALDVSVVVPVRGHGRALGRLLASLREHAPPGAIREILVVDDGGEEDISKICARFGATRVALPTPCGPAYARNAGARRAGAPMLLLFDADVLCPPGLFESIELAFAARPEAVAVSFLNPPYDPDVGIVANFASTLEYHWLSWYLGGRTLAPISGVSSRSAAVRRAAFESIGGFDISFSTNAIEDYDFGKRLAARGTTLVAAFPLVPHAYPRRFSRLARNYWVRSSTFIGYFLRHRMPLDPVQTARGEAALRLLGASSWTFLILAAFAGPFLPAALAAAATTSGAYAWILRPYLLAARNWSGSRAFSTAAFALHLATSPVIVVGAAWGLLAAAASSAKRGATRRDSPNRVQ